MDPTRKKFPPIKFNVKKIKKILVKKKLIVILGDVIGWVWRFTDLTGQMESIN